MNSKLYLREKQGFNGKKPNWNAIPTSMNSQNNGQSLSHDEVNAVIHLSSGGPLAVIEIRVWVELQLSFSYRFGRYFFLVERHVKRVYNLVARRQLHDVRADKSYIQVRKIYGASDFAVR